MEDCYGGVVTEGGVSRTYYSSGSRRSTNQDVSIARTVRFREWGC